MEKREVEYRDRSKLTSFLGIFGRSGFRVKSINFLLDFYVQLQKVLLEPLMGEFKLVVVEKNEFENLDVFMDNIFGRSQTAGKNKRAKGSVPDSRQKVTTKRNCAITFQMKQTASQIWHKTKLKKSIQNGSILISFRKSSSKKFWLQLEHSMRHTWNVFDITMLNRPHFQALLPGYRTKVSQKVQMAKKSPSGSLFRWNYIWKLSDLQKINQ